MRVVYQRNRQSRLRYSHYARNRTANHRHFTHL